MSSQVLRESTPKDAVKYREGRGNNSYPYVEWPWVNSVLIRATQNHYDFKITNWEIIQPDDQPRTEYDKSTRKRVPVLDDDGNPEMVPQPPVLIVYGALTLYDYSLSGGSQYLGTRENFGAQVLMGPADQWGDAFKSATSDCLKKCAQLFGVGLDLAGELDQRMEDGESMSAQEQLDDSNAIDFEEDDINDLRNLLDCLGIDPDAEDELIKIIEDFSGNQYHSFTDITPANIKSFNRYLNELLNT